jgi:hypothetical protein
MLVITNVVVAQRQAMRRACGTIDGLVLASMLASSTSQVVSIGRHCLELERTMMISGERTRIGTGDFGINDVMAKRKASRGTCSVLANQASTLLPESSKRREAESHGIRAPSVRCFISIPGLERTESGVKNILGASV